MERPLVVDKVLLVEGLDDKHVVENLCSAARAGDLRFAVKSKGGYENLRQTLDTELDASGLLALGVLVDANASLASRWQSLGSLLRQAGYAQMPAQPASDGTVLTVAGRPAVGLWLMPNNQLPGMLEDFVAHLVPPGDTLWPHALDSVARIPEIDRRFAPQHLSKAHIHTWLAWQKEPGTPL